jgi:hypothetical protein
MRKFLILGTIVAALAFAACGEEDDGGGICENPESQACLECLDGLFECALVGACQEEYQTLGVCESSEDCASDEDPSCCTEENAALAECLGRECGEYSECVGEF